MSKWLGQCVATAAAAVCFFHLSRYFVSHDTQIKVKKNSLHEQKFYQMLHEIQIYNIHRIKNAIKTKTKNQKSKKTKNQQQQN